MDPLSQLKDIQLPEAIPLWPPAIGWWVLAALILISVIYLCYFIYKAWKNKAVAKLALKQLKIYLTQHQSTPNKIKYAQNINILLKQVALNYYPPISVAKLSGNSWLMFLNKTGKTTNFTDGPANILAKAPYATTLEFDVAAVDKCCKAWVKKQK